MVHTLWTKMNHNGKKSSDWKNRDRFVLPLAGHGSMTGIRITRSKTLFGYGITVDDIKEFRQWGSKTPGHQNTVILKV